MPLDKRPNIEDVVAALQNAGDFSTVATLLKAVDIAALPLNATILAPDDRAVSQLDFLSFVQAKPIIQYHVLTHQLPFRNLQQLIVGTRIDTLLINKTVVVTSNDVWNFTLNHVVVTRADLFSNSGLVVHGLDGILNPFLHDPFTAFGPDSDSDQANASNQTASMSPDAITAAPSTSSEATPVQTVATASACLPDSTPSPLSSQQIDTPVHKFLHEDRGMRPLGIFFTVILCSTLLTGIVWLAYGSI